MAKAKGVTKVQHQKMKPIEGPVTPIRGQRAGDCSCGGVLNYAKVVRVKGSARMGRVCAGREAQKRKGFFETEDGKKLGREITEIEFRQAKAKAEMEKTDVKVMETEVVVVPEIKPCGMILGHSKGNIFGAA